MAILEAVKGGGGGVLTFERAYFLKLLKLYPALNKIKKKDLLDPVHLVSHSKEVRPGYVFLSLSDQGSLIEEAIRLGANVLIVKEGLKLPALKGCTCSLVEVKDIQAFFAFLLNEYYGFPSRQMMCIGITGTNGKTTLAHLLSFLLSKLNWEVALLGTIYNQLGSRKIRAKLTTEKIEELYYLMHRFLVKDGASFLKKKGLEQATQQKKSKKHKTRALVAEISSHALQQRRVEGIDFDILVFSNLSPDHLDYHGNMENYYQAKKKLFRDHFKLALQKKKFPGVPYKKKASLAVVNQDDPFGRRLIEEVKVSVTTFSEKVKANSSLPLPFDEKKRPPPNCRKPDFTWELISEGLFHTEFILRKEKQSKSWRVKLPLSGTYHVVNAVGALISGELAGESLEHMIPKMLNFKGVPGRLEPIKFKEGPIVFIDYAHTPQALELTLSFLSKHKRKGKKLICVFGCGGQRDQDKRPRMGKIGAKYSDVLLITSDNPRGENPLHIARDCLKGVLPNTEKLENGQKKAPPAQLLLKEGKKRANFQKNEKTKPEFIETKEKSHLENKNKSSLGPKSCVFGQNPYFHQKHRCKLFLELDRKKAIRLALSFAKKEDIVLIAGKGHERRQQFSKMSIPFNDKDFVNELYKERLGQLKKP